MIGLDNRGLHNNISGKVGLGARGLIPKLQYENMTEIHF